MRIDALTYGLSLSHDNFSDSSILNDMLKKVARALHRSSADLHNSLGYQGIRTGVALNSFEHWLPIQDHAICIRHMNLLCMLLKENDIDFCNIGQATSELAIRLIPVILNVSPILYASSVIPEVESINFVPQCKLIASSIKQTPWSSKMQYGVTINPSPNNPFCCTAYHPCDAPPTLTLSLECADLLFISFHGVTDETQAIANLHNSLLQVTSPIETCVKQSCSNLDIVYGGIDPSPRAGNILPESVIFGLEQFMFGSEFGSLHTSAELCHVVGVVGQAIARLRSDVTLCGFCGLVLSPMKDILLAERLVQSASPYSARDLQALHSRIGGGGLCIDAIPVAAGSTEEQLVELLMDFARTSSKSNEVTSSFSCSLVPIDGPEVSDSKALSDRIAGNTKVVLFSLAKNT